MVRRHLAMVAFVGIATMVWGAGCSSAQDENLGESEGAATPPNPSTLFDQADTCDRLFKRHAAVQQVDFEQGVIRWGAMDVPGVTEPNLGQEYCEYNAVQNGKIIKRATEIASDADPEAGGKVSCVFTSVFTGANQQNMLKAAMAAPENLGVAAAANGIVQMQVGFNSRGAATQLFKDCARNATASNLETRLRTTAVYQAFAKGGPNAARLREIGRGNLSVQSAWDEAKSLGAEVVEKGHPDYELQQDITACMAVRGAGAPWRNSDPMICARVGRTAQDCSCRFNAVPNALMGVPLTGWVNDSIPSSCRYVQVEGEDYPFVVICDLTAKEVEDVQVSATYSRSLQNFCRDKYAVDLVLKLPFRELQTANTCQAHEGFCADYMTVAPAPQIPQTPVSEDPTSQGPDVSRDPIRDSANVQ